MSLYRDVRFDFSGRVALVTGVGSRTGVGRGIAEAFFAAGASVAGCDIDRAAIEELEKEAPQGAWFGCDVRCEDAVDRLVDRVLERFGRIDFLVNNAGIAPFSPLVDLAVDTWNRTFDTNVKSCFLLSRRVAREWIASGRPGAIVNISSISAHVSGEHKAHYAATKAAVTSLTKGLAIELSRFGIRVNAVELGTFDTSIVKEAYMQPLLERLVQDPGLPINRLGTARDAAGVVLFLCTDAAAYMTGSCVLVDGGDLAGGFLPTDVREAYERSRTQKA